MKCCALHHCHFLWMHAKCSTILSIVGAATDIFQYVKNHLIKSFKTFCWLHLLTSIKDPFGLLNEMVTNGQSKFSRQYMCEWLILMKLCWLIHDSIWKPFFQFQTNRPYDVATTSHSMFSCVFLIWFGLSSRLILSFVTWTKFIVSCFTSDGISVSTLKLKKGPESWRQVSGVYFRRGDPLSAWCSEQGLPDSRMCWHLYISVR